MTKVWLADSWKYYDEKLDEGDQKMAAVRCRNWIAVEVADAENGGIQDCSQRRPETKFCGRIKRRDDTVRRDCLLERIKSPLEGYMYMDDENRTDEVPIAN